MANCHYCEKSDGWGHVVVAANGERLPLCITCWRTGCHNCGESFDGRKHQAHEMVFTDQDGHKTEAEVWCAVCARKRKGGERV